MTFTDDINDRFDRTSRPGNWPRMAPLIYLAFVAVAAAASWLLVVVFAAAANA